MDGKFLKLFKKLAITHKEDKPEQVLAKPVRKISTPFAFSHISHVDNSPVESSEPNTPKLNDDESKDSLSPLVGKKDGPSALCFNPTSPTVIKSKNGSFPRSASTSTIQSSIGKNSLFSRSESISSSLYSRKDSINLSTPLNMKKLKTVSLAQVSINNHNQDPNFQQGPTMTNSTTTTDEREESEESEEIELEYNKHINYNLQEIIKSIDEFNENYQQSSTQDKYLNQTSSHDVDDVESILRYHEVEDELRTFNNNSHQAELFYQNGCDSNDSEEVVYDKF